MTRKLPGYQPEKKANPKKKPHPWGVWMPGWLRDNGRKERGND